MWCIFVWTEHFGSHSLTPELLQAQLAMGAELREAMNSQFAGMSTAMVSLLLILRLLMRNKCIQYITKFPLISLYTRARILVLLRILCYSVL